MDLSSIFNYFFEHRWVLLFYTLVILFVYINRRKFIIEAKIIALYKTKVGLKLMDKIGKKHGELIKIIGYIGIGVGFIVMVYITSTLVLNLYKLLTIPGTQSVVAPVLPGVRVPGSPIFIPLISGWIALFLVIVIHEFSHGVVAVAHKIKIKSSGIFFLGPLMGAFVEPDEKQLAKKSDVVKYSVFAAGPLSNILLSLILAFIILFAVNPMLDNMTESTGFSIEAVDPGTPAEIAGLEGGMVFNKVNGVDTINYQMLIDVLDETKPGEEITLSTDQEEYTLTTIAHAEDPDKPYIGVLGIKDEVALKSSLQSYKIPYEILLFLFRFIGLVFMLSMGIGVANLLPLGIVDGGRMLQIALHNTIGIKKGNSIWKNISIATFLLLILNLVLGLVIPGLA